MYKILLTCPPMIGLKDTFTEAFAAAGFEVTVPEFTQIVPEARLIEMLPGYDGWIIGDDPATRAVFEAGTRGRLKAAVKWGVGTDNVDFAACRDLGLPITNTPGVFGREVADLAMSYVLALARQTFEIDAGIRAGGWPKPSGISLWNKRAGVIGAGDIGRNTVKRLLAHDLEVCVFDPFVDPTVLPESVTVRAWPEIDDLDFLVFTAPLTAETRHMFNTNTLSRVKPGVRLVNVGRGPVVQEAAVIAGLETGQIHSAALDVFEAEPLAQNNPLHTFRTRCLFGSHNGSNTQDAVTAVSLKAVWLLHGFLEAARATG
ncbi:MAG: phosphoglycerate dehydrogenase [Roseicyclus sp.]|jgi:D-3-phosphoglycerate dehydrogenase|nr:phosphoglycerate dehydrogenase [Roseicyclus sp.]